MRFVAVGLTLVAVVVLLGVAVQPGVTLVSAGLAAPAANPVLRVDPSVMEVGVGDKFFVDVMVDNASNMGAGEFDLTFSNSNLTANSEADGGFLATTGRQMPSAVGAPGPLGSPAAGLVPFGQYSIGGSGSPNGPNGTGRFATIQFTANAAGSSNLNLGNALVTDINGTSQTLGTLANGLVTIDALKKYFFTWYDTVSMMTWVLVGNPQPTGGQTANVDIYVGANNMGTYSIPPGGNVTPIYSGILDGPVRVVSTNGVQVFSSERALYGDSFNEVMSVPRSELTTEYWFTWYDDVSMMTWILVGNPQPTGGQTANVDIYIAGSKMGSYSIAPGASVTPIYPGVLNGPVRVISTNGVPVFASQRALYGGSFNELMGLSKNDLATEYWFTWYDGQSMTTWVLVGNPEPAGGRTANVDIYIGANKMGTYSVAPGASVTPSYAGVLDGPVRVVSTNGVPVFASERALYGGSFNELMGLPTSRFASDFWFTWYDDVSMMTWVLIGNPQPTGGQTANVDLYIGGTKMDTFSIPPGGRVTPIYAGILNGPVHVVSTNGVQVFSSERVLYKTSFNEIVGTSFP